MTARNHYVRYHSKGDDFAERYVVVDARTKEVISAPLPYQTALSEAERRDGGDGDGAVAALTSVGLPGFVRVFTPCLGGLAKV